MSGTISPTMIMAAAGLMKGTGLQVSGEMTSTLSTFDGLPLTQSTNNLIASLNGAGIALPAIPSFLSGNVNGTQLTSTISDTANNIAPDTKKFVSNFSGASAFGSASFAWSAAITEASSKGFGDFGLGMSKFSDLASGGLSKIMSPAGGLPLPAMPGGLSLPAIPGGSSLPTLPSLPGISVAQLTAKPDFAALKNVFNNFGNAFDPSNLQKMFDPAGYIKNLNKQGLGDVGGLRDQLEEAGVDPDNPESADPVLLRNILATIKGSDLQKIVTETGIVLPATANLQSAADMLEANNILPSDVISKLPGGSLTGLGNALGSMGGTFKSSADLANMLGGIKVPELPHLDSLDKLVPDDVMAEFKPMLGSGGGPFGNPTLQDIIGTASGHGHTNAFKSIIDSHNKIMQSPVGQNFKAASDALAADPTNPAKLAAFEAANTALAQAQNADLAAVVKKASDSVEASMQQLTTETSNQTVAGIDPVSAETPGPTQLLGLASKLHDMGLDKQQLGFNDMLNNMATNDKYGDAIRATLMEGKNIAAQAAAGIPNTTKIDPAAVLKKLQSG